MTSDSATNYAAALAECRRRLVRADRHRFALPGEPAPGWSRCVLEGQGRSAVVGTEEIRKRILDQYIPEPNSGCWLWTAGIKSTGYGQTSFRKIKITAHRASWLAFKGSIPEGLWVLHKCDVPTCVNPDHLWLGTVADNNRDKLLKGRHYGHSEQFRLSCLGEKNRAAKLTESQVRAILSDRRVYREIALSYGVSSNLVRAIKGRRVWSHLDAGEAA